MAFKYKIITLGKTNKFLFLLLIGGVLFTSIIVVENCSKSFTEQKKHPVIYTLSYSIGLSLSFILLIIYKKRNKNKIDHNANILLKQISSVKKFIWYFFISIINYFAYIILCIFWINVDNYFNTWGIMLLFMSLFSHFILNVKLYRHHYLSIIAVVAIGFIYNFVMNKFSEEKISKDYFSYSVQFVNVCLISLINVIYKYLMDKKNIISYEIIFAEGLIMVVFCIVTLIITTKLGVIDNFFDFINGVDQTEIYVFISLTLIQFILYSIEIIVINMFSPTHILLIYIIKDFLIVFIYLDDKLPLILYVVFCIGISCCILMILVFTEIVELNFLGLSKMTKKNIELRARLDSVLELNITEDDISENDKINYEEYYLYVDKIKPTELDCKDNKSINEKKLVDDY